MAINFGLKGGKKASKEVVVGKIRKTQLITTFGSGSIVDMPDYSVIIAGVNYWKDKSPILHELNLERLLKVSHFKEPYVSDTQDDEMKPDVPAFRFPYWHFCPDPSCGRLMPYWGFGDTEDHNSCAHNHPKRNIVSSRFIVACINGHLEDFPYAWWVHYGDFSKCPPEKHRGALRIKFSDESGGLESIIIQCTACGKSRTMEGCMSKDALRGYSCRGKRPWLGRKKDYNAPKPCHAQLRVLQRGASNVYFAMTAGALTIPPWSSKIQQEIASKWNSIENLLTSKHAESVLKPVVNAVFHDLLTTEICSYDELIDEIWNRYNGSVNKNYTKQNLMEDEYRVFCRGNYDEPNDVQFKIVCTEVPDFLTNYIEDIVLVKRLREVLALRGFRRITPEQPNSEDERFREYHINGDCIPLGAEELNWLPAIELLGEGLFIRIKEKVLEKWEKTAEEEYLPMRERLKQSNVSTSSSDSDGSLGGLVRMGFPESFEMIFKNMLKEASWCSSDPICIDSHAQGYDSLNFAACHACALLPETSCEMRNCLLDRVAVVGTLTCRRRGFFGAILE